MKFNNKITSILLATTLVTISCTKDFERLNTNPESINEVDPTSLFYTAQTSMLTGGSLWYDVYASKLRWMQYTSNIWGYETTNFSIFSSLIGSQQYTDYNNVGAYITNMEYIMAQQEPQEQYAGLAEMGRITLIAKGIQTSDIHGSLAYSAAWKAKQDDQSEEALNPEFQTQEELYTLWDTELSEITQRLISMSGGGSGIGAYDRAYSGNLQNWIKAANALRLRIALRFWNRMPDKAKTIATEVLSAANESNLMSSIDDSFVFWHANDYTIYNPGDWHSIYDMNCASGPFMDYLKTYNDPRKGIFFLPNNLTPENVAAYNAQPNDSKVGYIDQSGNITNASRNISADLTRWEGGTVSFDQRQYDEPYLSRTLNTNPSVNMRAMNYPQTKIWKGVGYDGTGTGGDFAPILSYADFCFMAAEFVLRLQVPSTASAQQWYEKGVEASLKQWDKFGDHAKVDNYSPITQEIINDFLAQDGIKWDPAIGLEQIYTQAYVEHFKNTNESWAQWKRTGYPNTQTTIMKWDEVMINGQRQNIPRKVKFSYPVPGTNNYENVKERLDEMVAHPEFGTVDNEFGKLWSEN